MDYGTLRVTTPDGQVREYPIDGPSVVIGRSEGNGVVIDHVSVGRRHAQLRIEDDKVTIEDLGSANGTFVGSQRVPPGQQQPIGEQTVRFGDVEARYLAAGGGAIDSPTRGASAAPGAEATIAVSLTSPSAPVAAGSTTTATVVIQNRGATTDQVSIRTLDLPDAWVRLSRASLALVSGARDEVTVVIQPPREPQSAAGEHPFSVAVVSAENGREVRVLGTFSILPFGGFNMELQGNEGDFRVALENPGNSPLDVELHAEDPAGKVDCQVETPEVSLAPGEKVTVPVRAAPSNRPLFSAVESRSFSVVARPSRGESERTARGTIMVKPPFRWWRLAVTPLIALIFFGGAGVGVYQYCGGFGKCFSTNDVKSAIKDGKKTPAPASTTPATTAVASPTPSGLYNGATAITVHSPAGNCLFVREYHTRQASDPRSKKVGELCDGDKVKIVSDKVEDEGFVWWTIDNGKGLIGWAAEKPLDGGEVFLQLSQ